MTEDDVLITGELFRRLFKASTVEVENRVLRDLERQITQPPSFTLEIAPDLLLLMTLPGLNEALDKMKPLQPAAHKILVIRHAEKPDGFSSPYGVNFKGERDSNSLTPEGWLRTGALVAFLAPTGGHLHNSVLATPQTIYAAGASAKNESQRCQETAFPLSRKLKLELKTHYLKHQEAELVKEVLTCAGVALICWKHDTIPRIANELLKDTTAAPQHWPEHRYDVVWIFTWDAIAGTYRFQQLPQCLLGGDSLTAIEF